MHNYVKVHNYYLYSGSKRFCKLFARLYDHVVSVHSCMRKLFIPHTCTGVWLGTGVLFMREGLSCTMIPRKRHVKVKRILILHVILTIWPPCAATT